VPLCAHPTRQQQQRQHKHRGGCVPHPQHHMLLPASPASCLPVGLYVRGSDTSAQRPAQPTDIYTSACLTPLDAQHTSASDRAYDLGHLRIPMPVSLGRCCVCYTWRMSTL
jgi:hypothetical protein